MDIKTSIQQFYKNLPNKSRILILVSGGVDSMCLLHACSQVIPASQLEALNINHQVRTENKYEGEMVSAYAQLLKIPCTVKTFNQQTDKNKEATWRKWRQKIINDFFDQKNCSINITAHHASDLCETMIFRLTKGCGIQGLSPFDIRTKPLWQHPKSDFYQYAKNHNVPFLEDPTNLQTVHERNKIRHKVIPTLKEITPNLEKVMVREAQIFQEVEDFLETTFNKIFEEALKQKSIPLNTFLNQHPFLQKRFLQTIAGKTISHAEITDTLKWLQGQPEGNTFKSIGSNDLQLKQQQILWN